MDKYLIYNKLCDTLSGKLRIERDDDNCVIIIPRLPVNGKLSSVDMLIKIEEVCSAIYMSVPIKSDYNNKKEVYNVSKLTCLYNSSSRFHIMEFDPKDGSISLQHCFFTSESVVEQIHLMLFIMLREISRISDALISIIYQGVNADQAIGLIKNNDADDEDFD